MIFHRVQVHSTVNHTIGIMHRSEVQHATISMGFLHSKSRQIRTRIARGVAAPTLRRQRWPHVCHRSFDSYFQFVFIDDLQRHARDNIPRYDHRRLSSTTVGYRIVPVPAPRVTVACDDVRSFRVTVQGGTRGPIPNT